MPGQARIQLAACYRTPDTQVQKGRSVDPAGHCRDPMGNRERVRPGRPDSGAAEVLRASLLGHFQETVTLALILALAGIHGRLALALALAGV